jgi:hypothetical protein
MYRTTTTPLLSTSLAGVAAKPFLTVTEAAELAGIPRATFYRYVQSVNTNDKDSLLGRAVFRQAGTRTLVRRSMLNSWINGQASLPNGYGNSTGGA